MRALEFNFGHVHLIRKRLQFAGLVALAGEAASVMVGKDQLQHGTARFEHLRGSGLDFKPFGYGQHAGSLQFSGFGIFDKAHPARTDVVDVLEVAQRRNLDALFQRCFQHRHPGLRLNRSSVDFESYHLSKPFLDMISGSRRRKALHEIP